MHKSRSNTMLLNSMLVPSLPLQHPICCVHRNHNSPHKVRMSLLHLPKLQVSAHLAIQPQSPAPPVAVWGHPANSVKIAAPNFRCLTSSAPNVLALSKQIHASVPNAAPTSLHNRSVTTSRTIVPFTTHKIGV
jgi:hypothetical protein